MINAAYEKTASQKIPPLVDKTAIEIKEGGALLTRQFKDKGATVAVHIDMGGSAGSYGQSEKGVVSVRGLPSRLPFEDGFFDYIIAHFANQFQGDISKSVKEFSRLLSIAGEGIITDFHPFGMYAKRGNIRLKPVESTIRGVEDYYKMCAGVGLKVTSVKESFFDENLRPMFVTEDEKSAFRIVKDTPLLIHLYVRKGG
jgi:SAM-dependent methyltransferase